MPAEIKLFNWICTGTGKLGERTIGGNRHFRQTIQIWSMRADAYGPSSR